MDGSTLADIDTMEDWNMAEVKMRFLLEKKKGETHT